MTVPCVALEGTVTTRGQEPGHAGVRDRRTVAPGRAHDQALAPEAP